MIIIPSIVGKYYTFSLLFKTTINLNYKLIAPLKHCRKVYTKARTLN